MAIEWYMVLSAMLFAVGPRQGVLIRRNPVVILPAWS